MSQCSICTRLRPVKKPVSNCRKKAERVEELRLFCPSDLTEAISPSFNNGCVSGYISNLLNPDPSCNATPIVSVDIINQDEFDENKSYQYDKDEDIGNFTHSLGPALIRAYTPEDDCTIESMAGKKIGIIFKIVNRDGEYQWRRFYGLLTEIGGGLIKGYELIFEEENPLPNERPMYINFGDHETTENAINALTKFDNSDDDCGIDFVNDYTTSTDRLEINDYQLPTDTRKILLYRGEGGLLLSENHQFGYTISDNGFNFNALDVAPDMPYRLMVFK